MKIKKGASLIGLQMQMRPVLIAADNIWKEYGHELVITAGTDGVHSAGSLHYYGFAVDLRTRYFADQNIVDNIAVKLRKKLGKDYDVVVHSSHIHVEYDPKRECL